MGAHIFHEVIEIPGWWITAERALHGILGGAAGILAWELLGILGLADTVGNSLLAAEILGGIIGWLSDTTLKPSDRLIHDYWAKMVLGAKNRFYVTERWSLYYQTGSFGMKHAGTISRSFYASQGRAVFARGYVRGCVIRDTARQFPIYVNPCLYTGP